MRPMLRRLYLDWVLGRPWLFVVAFLAVGAFFAWKVPDFKVGAGTSSLVLEGDDSKRVYDETRELFTSDDYVLVAVQPADPWSDEGIRLVDELAGEIRSVPGISSVLSPTTVPLLGTFVLGSPGLKTLMDEGVDRDLAREELSSWPLYRNQLMASDGKVFNLVAFLETRDPEEFRREYRRLSDEAAALDDPPDELLDRIEAARLRVLESKAEDQALQRSVVTGIRQILPRYRERGAVAHVAGLPSLSMDMVDYLNHDIAVFGVAVAGFLLVTLFVLFRRPRFVILPLLTCLLTVVTVLGLMVALEVETTVVTSNITSLLFIIGMAHSIHLVVKYREERALHPDRPYKETLWAAVHAIAEPCLYTALTTAVGFGSLYVTDVAPVKDFAVFMSFGVMLAFAVSLLFLPACLALLPPTSESVAQATAQHHNAFLDGLAGLALRRRRAVYLVSLAVAVLAAVGASRVIVDQRFIDYFRSDTEVHRGLDFVDRVGGTMTVEVILYGDGPDYWLEEANYARVKHLHEWFEGIPQVGKTLSLVSFRDHVTNALGRNNPRASTIPIKGILRMARMAVPADDVRAATSSVSNEDFSITRVYVRLRESSEELNRIGLLNDLRTFLDTDADLAPERAKPEGMRPQVTGMFVLFTNMLNTLVGSQTRSFGLVFVAVAGMLALLFLHLGVGLLSMPPNVLPIAMVLGTMGFAAIALDLMTIMIASISLGIAVDACIHYVVRFRRELVRTGDWEAAVAPSHQSIGKAILYTALTVFVGFLVLVLSRFTPTIYFGLLTGVAMVAGLLANLIVLPALLVTFRPFRRDAAAARDRAGEGP